MSGKVPSPPIPPDEEVRLAVLRAYEILDTPPEEAFDELTALAAHICEAPVSLITLVDEDRQWIKSGVGDGAPRETSRHVSFCAHAINQTDTFIVADTLEDERFRDNPYVTSEPHIRFYAGAPLISPEGQAIGTLCVFGHEPRKLKSDHQLALRVLSRHVMALLELRQRRRDELRSSELEASVESLRRDVAERRRAEAEVLRERDHSDQIINSLPGVFYLFDHTGRMLRWNRNFERVTGYYPDEIGDLHPRDFFEGADQDRVAQRIEEAFEVGQAHVEADLVSKDGESIPHFLTGRRIDYDGRPCLVGMGVDITSRKRAEAERDRLFELSPDMFCIAGLDGYFKQLNPAWEETLGYSRHELLARPYLEFLHPDDRLTAEDGHERMKQGLPPKVVDGRFRCKDGSWKWLSWRSMPVPEEGLIYAVARDVTREREVVDALRTSEERYRNLVESAPDGIFTVSSEGILTSMNPAFQALTGRTQEEWVGRRLDSLVHPEDRGRTATLVQAALEGRSPPAFQLLLVSGDGSSVPMELTVTPQQEEERVVGALGIARDLRERLRLEEQLRRIQKLDSVGRLAAGIAHDFNNLLTVQQATVSLLLMDEELPEGVAEGLGEVAGAAERAAALTRQLLMFSRKQPIRLRPLELNDIVGGLARILRRTLGADVELELDLDGRLPTVEADPGMIEQVLMNLSVNARDAMPRGGRLTIKSSRSVLDQLVADGNPEARPGLFACLIVRDTGTGIPPDILDHIFEPFSTTKEVGRGTGLGLATVHGIVQQHRGWIEVDSQVGSGTEFRIFLPATQAPRTQENPEGAGEGDSGSGRNAGSETILVVEDEPAVGRLVRTALRRHGYRVILAANGVEALEVWREAGEEVDLLLTDMVMPEGIGGRELAGRLRAQRPTLKVLFTSGYSPDMLGTDRGAEEPLPFLQKPYQVATLLKAVRTRLDVD
jgi:PAS domain S-box-containing protein